MSSNDLLYFADICAGPGGFSEYVLWRKSWDAKGFGFTLKGPSDFKLEDFFAAPCELFEPHYGMKFAVLLCISYVYIVAQFHVFHAIMQFSSLLMSPELDDNKYS